MSPPRCLPLVAVPLLLFAGCIGSSAGPDPDTPTAAPGWVWDAAAPTHLARSEAQCASDGRTLLVVGGFTGAMTDPVTPTTEVYDLTTDTWAEGPLLPFPMHHTGVAHAAGRFWLAGGYAGQWFTPHNLLLSWAPGEATWRADGVLPHPRGAHGVGVVGDQLVLVGGAALAVFVYQVDIYDIPTGTWHSADPLTKAREHLSVVGDGTSVYATAGRTGGFGTESDRHEILDTTTGTWSTGPSIPTARGGVGGAMGPHGLIVVGGESAGGTYNETERYTDGAWTALPDMPTSRHGVCAAWMEDGLHVVAGGEEPGWTVSRFHDVLRPPATQNP